MTPIDIDACYNCVIQAVDNASKIVMDGFEGVKSIANKTASYDIVTEYDKKTEIFLINTIREVFPDHKFIGEETLSKVKLTDDPTWIIDPIDGTVNFVHSVPDCAICLGLSVNKEIILGIVSSPALGQTFTAIKGRGAFLNGKPIHVSRVTELKEALIGFEMSLAAMPHLTDIYMERLRTCVTQVQGIRALGSSQMTLCQVAMGKLDGYQVEFLWPWDVAAGSIIVLEAGGVVLDVDGGKFDFEKGRIIAASTQELAQKLVKIVQIK